MNGKTNFFEGSYLAQMLGPLFLIPVILFAGQYKPALNYDLVAIAGLGLLLASAHQTRGCFYALILLAVSATIKHIWLDSHHLVQLCLECSVAFSLILTALVFTEATDSTEIIQAQIERKEETIRFLEEDLSKHREKAAVETTLSNDKLAALQELAEETQNELSAIQMLNEVLRKSTAKAIDQGAKTTSLLLCAESRSGLLLEEIDSLQRELHRLSNESGLVQQNKDLFKELNAARVKSTQTHLINETLARMLAAQAEKNQEAEQAQQQLEQLTILHAELQQQFADQAEKNQQTQQAQQQLEQLTILHAELQQQLAGQVEKTREAEQILLQQQLMEKHSSDIRYLNENLSKRLAQTAETEALYRQLRDQFAQKDKVLHQTRSQLFTIETELEKLQKELYEKQLHNDPLPPSIRRELETAEEERMLLAEENHHLTELVTQLMASAPEKKKLKRKESLL